MSDQRGNSPTGRQATRVSAFAAAQDAYNFLFRCFWHILRLALLPIVAASVVLYVALSIYLKELLLFLDAPNPQVASLALGTLAAGLFLSLFCYAIAVAAISDLALGKATRGTWLHFKAERQEWRIYAAYLRFLLLVSLFFGAVFFLSTYAAPLLMIPTSFSPWILTLASIVGIVWLFVRIGFLIAPVIAAGEGTVLRKAKQESARDLWRNGVLIALLLVPGVLVQIGGEYAFRMGISSLRPAGALTLADTARSMSAILSAFLAVTSVSFFVTIVLLTAGAIAVYLPARFRGGAPQDDAKHLAFGSNLARSIPAEGPPK